MLRKTVLRLNYLLLARRAMAFGGLLAGPFPTLDPGQAYRPRLGRSPLLTKFDRWDARIAASGVTSNRC